MADATTISSKRLRDTQRITIGAFLRIIHVDDKSAQILYLYIIADLHLPIKTICSEHANARLLRAIVE